MSRRTALILRAVCIFFIARTSASASEFRVAAAGGNTCGFWGPPCVGCCIFVPGFSACSPQPVSDSNSFFDTGHPATYRYTAHANCGELFIHTEIDWSCGCGSLCGQNGGTARMVLDDVVFTGPPGATAAFFRMNIDLAVPISDGRWRLQAIAPSGPLVDTGDQFGVLPLTHFVSALRSASLNSPQTFSFEITTGISAVEQAPHPRSEAMAQFPCGLPGFTFFDQFGNPVSGFSVQSPTCAFATLCSNHSGDMNADNVANGRDIQRFVDAVLAGSTAVADTCPGDFSNNCVMDVNDLLGFAAVLLAP